MRRIAMMAPACAAILSTSGACAMAKPQYRPATDEEARMAILCVRNAIMADFVARSESERKYGSKWIEFDLNANDPPDKPALILDYVSGKPWLHYYPRTTPRPCAAQSEAVYAAAIEETIFDPDGVKGHMIEYKYIKEQITERPLRIGNKILVTVRSELRQYMPNAKKGDVCGPLDYHSGYGVTVYVLKRHGGAWRAVATVNEDVCVNIPRRKRCDAPPATTSAPTPPFVTDRPN